MILLMKLIFRIKAENINRIIGKSSDNNKQKIHLRKSDHNIQINLILKYY